MSNPGEPKPLNSLNGQVSPPTLKERNLAFEGSALVDAWCRLNTDPSIVAGFDDLGDVVMNQIDDEFDVQVESPTHVPDPAGLGQGGLTKSSSRLY